MSHENLNQTRRNLLRTTGVLAGGSVTGGGFLTYGGSPASAATSVIDDFEDNDLSQYSFDRGSSGASIVTSPTHSSSSYALSLSGVAVEMISRPGGSTPDLANYPSAGDTFRYHVRATGGVHYTNYTYGVQDHNNRYFVRIGFTDNKFRLYKYADGSATELVRDDTITVAEDQWYELEVDWASDGTHTITLLNDTDSQVGQISYTDATWTSGGIGYDGYMDDGGTLYIDDVLLGDSSDDGGGGDDGDGGGGSSVIEDFEDGGLTEYAFDRGSSGASLVSSPVYQGSSALEISGTDTEMISTSGLDTYPAAGETFRFRFRSPTNEVANLTYGVQDHANRYFVQLDYADQYLKLVRWQNDTGDQFGIATNVPYTTGVWYDVEVEWQADGTHVATLYDTDGTQLAQATGTDSTWTSGGIGFDGYYAGGGAGYYDYVTKSTATELGMFESGLDSWSPTGSTQLSRADPSSASAAITQGTRALEVTVNGDSEPIIQNQARIQAADLENCPYLLADVLPVSVDGTTSPVTIRFRYHHTNPGGVEESHEMTVDQRYGGRICWDMSGLSTTKLANPDRLEIAWYPRDHPPGSGFNYSGQICIDNVRLTDDRNQVDQARYMRQHREHERAHGPMIDQKIQSQTDTTQDGVYEYHDGTQISYHVERLANGNIQETCDGETFTWEVSS